MKTNPKLLTGFFLSIAVLAPYQAQAQAQAQGVKEPVTHTHAINGNPLLLLAGWFNAEYEHKVAETFTAGISGGWLELDDADYTSVSGFLRYYPQEAVFTGFYLGGRAGIHNVDLSYSPDDGDDSNTAFGIGVDIGYTWLLGPGRSFYVGMGIGATRLFSNDLHDTSSVVPSVRLINVGVAF